MKAFLFCSMAAAGLLFAEDAVAEPNSLKAFFTSEGFAGAPLQRRFGNHLFVSTLINKHPTRLMIDTGAPHTLIDKGSARRLGLNVQATKLKVGRVWGGTREHFGASKLETLAMGNCMLLDVPVMIADESEINYYSHLARLDGLFGAHEMLRFGMVIDCARQMLYINPRGASGETSKRLANFLARRGFTRIPMRFNFHRHFEVDASINGHATRLVVDTGAGTTMLGRQIATRSAVPAVMEGALTSKVKELVVGSFRINEADVTIANVAAEIGPGLLGEEYLSWNFAVIDVGGLALYLRHPDSR